MPDNHQVRTPTDQPPNRFTRATRSGFLFPVVHSLARELTPDDLPRFRGPAPRHWLTRWCSRASRDGRTQFYGRGAHRVEVCPCGRDRSWPVGSGRATSKWLGKTGRAGRRYWHKRQRV